MQIEAVEGLLEREKAAETGLARADDLRDVAVIVLGADPVVLAMDGEHRRLDGSPGLRHVDVLEFLEEP